MAAVPHHPSLLQFHFLGWWRFGRTIAHHRVWLPLVLTSKDTYTLLFLPEPARPYSALLLGLGAAAGRPSVRKQVAKLNHITIHLLHLHPAQVHLASELWELCAEALALLGTTSKMSSLGGCHEVAKAALDILCRFWGWPGPSSWDM